MPSPYIWSHFILFYWVWIQMCTPKIELFPMDTLKPFGSFRKLRIPSVKWIYHQAFVVCWICNGEHFINLCAILVYNIMSPRLGIVLYLYPHPSPLTVFTTLHRHIFKSYRWFSKNENDWSTLWNQGVINKILLLIYFMLSNLHYQTMLLGPCLGENFLPFSANFNRTGPWKSKYQKCSINLGMLTSWVELARESKLNARARLE